MRWRTSRWDRSPRYVEFQVKMERSWEKTGANFYPDLGSAKLELRSGLNHFRPVGTVLASIEASTNFLRF